MGEWNNRKMLLVALILALVTAGVAYSYLSSIEPAQQVEKADVLVAIQTIPANTVITREMVATKALPQDVVHPNAATSADEVVGKVTKFEILGGEQILSNRYAGQDSQHNRFSYKVPDGRRAITIAVTEITGVGGWPTVNDRVDILLKENPDEESQAEPGVRMFLQNVEILATGNLALPQEDGQQRVVPTFTLNVSLEEAQRITLAESKGSFRMVLRSPADKKVNTLTRISDI